MNTHRTAPVIGGGLAGPVTATALQKAGIDATVYEAYEQSSGLAHGVYLTVAVNGISALRAIGAQHTVTEHGFPTGQIEFAAGTGKRLAAAVETSSGGVLAPSRSAPSAARSATPSCPSS
ncbi:FAD-dependent oxidoreductase [Kitasatospora sp. NPDC089509]|uniref:FAD-dependent oxidoreductase n=1 Tax=Kitasatospora sp. NPDC089509 TaxID=3364079 RepID=UPI0038116C4E